MIHHHVWEEIYGLYHLPGRRYRCECGHTLYIPKHRLTL